MAAFTAIAAASQSLEHLFNQAFQQHPPLPGQHCPAILVTHQALAEGASALAPDQPALWVLLHRVTPNLAVRNGPRAGAASGGRGAAGLALDLHYLLIAHAPEAAAQHLVLGRTLQALHQIPELPGLGVSLVLEDLPAEQWTPLVAALPGGMALALPCVARALCLDLTDAEPG